MYSPQCGGSSNYTGDYLDDFYSPEARNSSFLDGYEDGAWVDEAEKEAFYANIQEMFGTRPARQSTPSATSLSRSDSLTPSSEQDELAMATNGQNSSPSSSLPVPPFLKQEVVSPTSSEQVNPWEASKPMEQNNFPSYQPFKFDSRDGMYTPPMLSPPPMITNQQSDQYNPYNDQQPFNDGPCPSFVGMDSYDLMQVDSSYMFVSPFFFYVCSEVKGKNRGGYSIDIE
ncbi:unnamed protein product [Caenorhabditis nigoni]